MRQLIKTIPITALWMWMFVTTAQAQFKVMHEDDFSDFSKFRDLSKLLLWGENTEPQTVFEAKPVSDTSNLSYNALQIPAANQTYVASFTDSTGLKTHSAIEYVFPAPFYRTQGTIQDTIMVEFDAIFDALATNGEGQRIVVSLMHDLKPGGPQFNDCFKLNEYHPFGRPAYNFRLLPKAPENNRYGIFMLYGGGHVKEGEVEKTSNWWIPGFSTSAGGQSPGCCSPYPFGTTGMYSPAVASATTWHHYSWVITPDRLMMYRRRSNQTKENDVLLYTMHTPTLGATNAETLAKFRAVYGNSVNNVPFLYNYFNKFESVRLYYRGKGANIANFKISYTGEELVTGQRQQTASTGTSHMELYPNPTTGDLNIRISEFSQWPAKVSIADLSGNVVLQVAATQELIQLDVSHLHKGLYIVKVNSANTTLFKKLIIQ